MTPSDRPSLVRRWWLLLGLAAIGLVLVGAKLSLRSLATGASLVPGVAGAPSLGPAPTPTATPGPQRVRLWVQVVDQAGQGVPQAVVEVRDRFNALAGQAETGPSGLAVLVLRPTTGYVVTARKQGVAQGRLEGVDVTGGAAGVPGPPAQATAPAPAAGSQGAPSGDGVMTAASPPGRGQLVQVRLDLADGVAAAPAARLYVGHSSPRLSLIDTASNLLLKHSEALGQGRQTLFAVAKDQNKVYAAWFSAPQLFVLNGFDLSIEREVPLGAGGITSMAIHPLNGRLWVATQAADTPESGVLHELDAEVQQVLRRVALPQTVSNLRFRPDGSILYLPTRAANSLAFFDPVAGAVTHSARMPQWPSDMALSPDGGSLYVVNLGSERLVVLDAISGEQRRIVEIGTGSSNVTAHPDGRRLFVANQTLGYVQVVDVEQGQVIDLIPVGRAPQSIVLTPDGRGLYVANAGSASLSLVDLDSRAVKETLNIGGAPSSVQLPGTPGD